MAKRRRKKDTAVKAANKLNRFATQVKNREKEVLTIPTSVKTESVESDTKNKQKYDSNIENTIVKISSRRRRNKKNRANKERKVLAATKQEDKVKGILTRSYSNEKQTASNEKQTASNEKQTISNEKQTSVPETDPKTDNKESTAIQVLVKNEEKLDAASEYAPISASVPAIVKPKEIATMCRSALPGPETDCRNHCITIDYIYDWTIIYTQKTVKVQML